MLGVESVLVMHGQLMEGLEVELADGKFVFGSFVYLGDCKAGFSVNV